MRHALEYVNYMIRLYTRNCEKQQRNFRREVDQRNFETVQRVLNDLSEWDKNVIIEVFRRNGPIEYTVQEVSKKFGVDLDVVWTVLSKTSRKIAKERELI